MLQPLARQPGSRADVQSDANPVGIQVLGLRSLARAGRMVGAARAEVVDCTGYSDPAACLTWRPGLRRFDQLLVKTPEPRASHGTVGARACAAVQPGVLRPSRGSDRHRQVRVGRRDPTHFGAQRAGAADALELPLLQYAQEFGLHQRLMSPISSRNSVPPAACSMRPILVAIAPVNAPFSCPNSSDSSSCSGSASQLMATNGLPTRGDHELRGSASHHPGPTTRHGAMVATRSKTSWSSRVSEAVASMSASTRPRIAGPRSPG